MRRALLVLMLHCPKLALAADITSEYTVIDRSKCQILQPANSVEEDGGSILCDGFAGHQVLFASGDNRDYLAFGKNPVSHCAAKQTFSAINTAGNKVEWRIQNNIPVAAILRWTVTRDAEGTVQKKDWLAVARLETQNSCVLALVDASWPNANDKARKVADEMSGEGFDCAGTSLRTFANEGTNVEVGSFGPACEAE